jgi:hypothetical protein
VKVSLTPGPSPTVGEGGCGAQAEISKIMRRKMIFFIVFPY